MSWFYRFFSKSDNEQVVTITAPYIQLTGAATLTGALSQVGNHTVTGNQTVTSTSRTVTSPLYLGSGTLGLFFGTATPWDTGVTGADKGSIYFQTVGGTAYVKTNYASTAWSTITTS